MKKIKTFLSVFRPHLNQNLYQTFFTPLWHIGMMIWYDEILQIYFEDIIALILNITQES